VDTSVGDIYGPGGCVGLGMPENMTAANFGKLADAEDIPRPEDLVCAALKMVVQVREALVISGCDRFGHLKPFPVPVGLRV
jgi:pantothenate kinase